MAEGAHDLPFSRRARSSLIRAPLSFRVWLPLSGVRDRSQGATYDQSGNIFVAEQEKPARPKCRFEVENEVENLYRHAPKMAVLLG
jgi:hypothetical protein